jgi:PIN domain
MLEEYVKVLARPKFSFPSDEIQELIALIRSRREQVSPSQPLILHSPDPDDDKFLACAVVASVDFIGTGDKQHYTEVCGNIRVAQRASCSKRLLLKYEPDLSGCWRELLAIYPREPLCSLGNSGNQT